MSSKPSMNKRSSSQVQGGSEPSISQQRDMLPSQSKAPSARKGKNTVVSTAEEAPVTGNSRKSQQRKATGPKSKEPELIGLTPLANRQNIPNINHNVARANTGDDSNLDNRSISRHSNLTHRREPPSNQMAGGLHENKEQEFDLTISIGGMTCASCTEPISEAIQDLDYAKSFDVNLMTNSANIRFVGPKSLSDAIVECIKDTGKEAEVTTCRPVPSEIENSQSLNIQRRTIELKIDGLGDNEHCPSEILETLGEKHPGLLKVLKEPKLKEPVLELSYQPDAPTFTIRDIASTIESMNNSLKVTLYHPPTVEDRSKRTQKLERNRILRRLFLSSLAAIPTLLIGVVWKDLVPSSNRLRQYFETPTWGTANVTRAEWALFIMATVVMFFAADVFHRGAFKEIRALWRKNSKVPVIRRFYRFGSMNLLISAGTSVAYFASLALLCINAAARKRNSQHNTYFDSVVFLTLFLLCGRYLEAYSKAKAGDAVQMLGKLRPREAFLVVQPNSERSDAGSHTTEANLIPTPTVLKIDSDLLEIGDAVIVARGSSPPADGIIINGSAQFDESSLTGESRNVRKGPGDEVYVGTVNTGDPISTEVTNIGGDSMLDQIVTLVREGLSKRAPVERLADILTGYFVPIITALAIITFFIWFALGQSRALSSTYIEGQAGGWVFWSLEFAIAVFVVACPCGIGLAAPTALFVGGGLAARHGILVRGGGEAFQEAGDLDAIVFDKTGTLTEGDLKVTDHEMHMQGEEAKIAWSIARILEVNSSHPIAHAIAELSSRQTSTNIDPDDITEEPGMGVRGSFTIPTTRARESVQYEAALGSENLIYRIQPDLLEATGFTSQTLSLWKSQGKSVALLAIREIRASDALYTDEISPWTLAALFATSDPIRPSALPVIRNLQDRGLTVYMLTGDNHQTAMSVATSVGIPISNVVAGVRPDQKADEIKRLQEHGPRRTESITHSKWTTFYRCVLRGALLHGTEAPSRTIAKVAFVGDGINDAPALATATVSFSLSSGSPIALSSSSFIILSPSLATIPVLLDLSTRVFRRIKINFIWALLYNVLLVPVAAGVFFWVKEGGWRLGPAWASAAMAGSSVSVVLSSLLLRYERGWMFWKRKGDAEMLYGGIVEAARRNGKENHGQGEGPVAERRGIIYG